MQIPIRIRLFINFLLVLLVGMVLAATLAWLAVEQLYLATQRENLLAQAHLTAATMNDSAIPTNPSEPYMQVSNIMPGVHTRLLSEQGGVVIGPKFPPGGPSIQVPAAENAGFVSSEELLQRSEIREALQGQPATAIRRVASADGRRILYAAVPIQDIEVSGILYLATPLPKNRLPLEITLQFLGAGLAAVLLASIAATILARGIALPIENLSQAARAVSEGDLTQQVPVEDRTRELNNLGRAFNVMTTSLRQSNQVKNAFIADVTHELRTPLTVIKGTTETLEDGAIDDLAGRGSLLASMHRETDRLIRLVNDLLVLTRADANALQIKKDFVDMVELAHSRARHLAPLAADSRVSLNVAAGRSDTGDELTVCGDADRLAQVLDNLLDNAIRHANDGSTVMITVQKTGTEIQCGVHNQGPSIPKQHWPFLFERFYRVDSSRNRKTGGTGLGLAIVQALISAQGGRIEVHSSLREGTTFTFWLPGGKD